jgi:hypothetical protein
MHHSRGLLAAVCAIFALLAGACAPGSSVTIGNDPRHSAHAGKSSHGGPPPHAPAHGHRHKHRHHGQDLELMFDSSLGVYVVVGLPNRYYWNGHYLRIDGDQWYASVNLAGDSGWKPRSDDSLPPGMQKHKKHSKTKRGKSHKSHPAKGHW